MYEAQSLPPENKNNTWTTWIWSALGGAAVGAAIASGVWWLLMREQQKRHQAEIVAITMGTVNPAALIGKMGDLISAEAPAANPAGLLGKVGDLFSGGGSATTPEKTETAPAKTETPPTKDELAAYFDGKTLPLPNGANL